MEKGLFTNFYAEGMARRRTDESDACMEAEKGDERQYFGRAKPYNDDSASGPRRKKKKNKRKSKKDRKKKKVGKKEKRRGYGGNKADRIPRLDVSYIYNTRKTHGA